MTVKREGKRKTKQLFAVTVAVILIGAAVFFLYPFLSPFFSRAALFAAMLSMPEGTFSALSAELRAGGQTTTEPLPGAGTSSGFAADLPPPPTPSQSEGGTIASGGLPEGAKALPYIPPDVPKEHQGRLLQEDWSGNATKAAFKIGNYWLRNDTEYSQEEIRELVKNPAAPVLEETNEPQVLIYHTHATESFCPYDGDHYDTRYNWRSTDNNNNMVAVGTVMVDALRAQGIAVIHDTEQHDYPSYNGSYANSYRSIKRYLAQYPTIKVVLDLHRDAIEREGGVIIKPTAEIGGKRYAQLMIVSNCDDGTGLLPNWNDNLSFAAAFAAALERGYPTLTRPILFSCRKYNQQLSSGALLLEFGSHASTLEEAKRTAEAVGNTLATLLEGKNLP